MIEVKINPKYNQFLEDYSKKLDLGGRSNLDQTDLAKASRRDFNYAGIAGEIAYRQYLYGHADDLQDTIDKKLAHYNTTGKGDGGCDDTITFKKSTRIVDVKSSHTENENRIKNLNLIIPENEFHKEQKMIFVAAFTVGKKRTEIEKVVLAGFCFTEEIFRRWSFDKNKFAVSVPELRDITRLKEMITKPNGE